MKFIGLFSILAPLLDCRIVQRRDLDHGNTILNDGNLKNTVYSVLDSGQVPVPNLNVKPSSQGTVNSTAIEAVTAVTSSATPYLDMKYMPGENDSKDGYSLDETETNMDIRPDPTYYTATLTMEPEMQTVMEGNMAQFNCAVTTNYDDIRIRWYHKSQDMLQATYKTRQYSYIRYGFETGQEPVDHKTGLQTFWSVLTFYEVAMSDYGSYECHVAEPEMQHNAQLNVQVRPLSVKKTCMDNSDCSWRSNFKCVHFRCQPMSPSTAIFSEPTSIETTGYASSLRFTVAAFLCGGLVITIVMFVILFREVCYKICEKPRTSRLRRNMNGNRQFVYVIGRNANGRRVSAEITTSDPNDKPPNYDACVSTSKNVKDETPPPSYRQQKTRDIPPPAYDAFTTSQPEPVGGASSLATPTQLTEASADERMPTEAVLTAAETTFPKELPK